MSMTLNLIDRLLARGRDLQRLGRDRDAYHVLHRLAGFRELSPKDAEETQVELAEIHLRHRHYRRARRHLAAALRQRPDNARYHYLMAGACDAEGTGDPRRVARHYRRSLQIEPDQPRCLVEYGLLNLREQRIEAGLTCLCRAIQLAPKDPEIVGKAADGFRLAGRRKEAGSVLRAALFRNPGDGRFRKLWTDFQFVEVARAQRTARREKKMRTDAGKLVVLPFVHRDRQAASGPIGARIIRADAASPAAAPHSPHPLRLPDQRHAQ